MKKNFTLLFTCLLLASHIGLAQDVILWGGVDEPNSTFEGGLNDWTTIGVTATPQDSAVNALWEWTADGTLDEGVFWGPAGTIISPTVDNGAAGFNSDFLDNGGQTDAQGQPIQAGVAPAPHRGELISPVIDMSNNASVFLKFNQSYRNFFSQTLIEVTNGVDSMVYEVNTDIGTNASTGGESVVILDISEIAANQANVRIKFIFDGDYYYWIVDDVQLIEPPKTNLAISDFFYPPGSFATPISQIDTDTFGFFAEIANLGSEDQFDVVFKAEVLNDAEEVIFVDSLLIDTVEAGLNRDGFRDDSLGVVFFIDSLFVPDTLREATYLIRYSVETPGKVDSDDTDNSVVRPFIVTDDIYSKELVSTTASRPGGAGGDYQLGNMYITSALTMEEYEATSASFQVAVNQGDQPLEGKQMAVNLIEVVEAEVAPDFSNFDNFSDAGPNNPQLKTVGTASYDFTSEDDNFQTITVDLLDFLGDFEVGVPLKQGNRYFLMASYEGANNVIFHAINDEDLVYFQTSTILFSQDASGTDRWFLGGFGPEVAAFMRMTISLATSVDNTPLPEASMKLYPNPASEYINMELDLEEQGHVTVTIADLAGRVIRIDELENTQRETRRYNLSNFANGTYLLRIATASGTKTRKFIVAH